MLSESLSSPMAPMADLVRSGLVRLRIYCASQSRDCALMATCPPVIALYDRLAAMNTSASAKVMYIS